jgi:hypothetical protein
MPTTPAGVAAALKFFGGSPDDDDYSDLLESALNLTPTVDVAGTYLARLGETLAGILATA